MLGYPGLELAAEGDDMLTYCINCNWSMDTSYKFEFRRDSVAIELSSAVSPVYFTNDALTMLVDIILFLRDCYVVGLDDLAPYLIEALSAQQLNGYLKNFNLKEHEHGGDVILSKRILALSDENGALKRDLQNKTEQAMLLLKRLIASSYNYNASIEAIEAEVHVGRKEIREALNGISEIGYRVVYSSRDKFSVIKHG
ncbi:MAG: hypothetical protein KGH72_05405 [Candidatus Micrarchaeota archaeon]|nr:hypothetical protein [Candidatus Micrarchaeota archaeon]